MLSKAGGAAFQRVVPKVADLPSPLDAHGDETYIVRETEEVYRFDQATRTWQMIGTLKKVGGKKPAELAEHLDSKANPHGVSLAQAYAEGADIELDEETGELVLSAKPGSLKALLRLLGAGGQGLRIGADAGASTAAIWVNGGKAGQRRPILRVVDEDGADQFLLDSDGNLMVRGATLLAGGVKGKTDFADQITARGGVVSPDTLKLGGKRVAVVAGERALILNEKGLGVGTEPAEALDIAGGLRLSGTVSSDLSPTDTEKFSLGDLGRRWKLVSACELDIKANPKGNAALRITASPDQLAALMEVGGGLVVTADGHVGMLKGAEIQGGLILGAPGNQFRLMDDEQGARLTFNVDLDGSPEDERVPGWITSFGGRRDAFEVLRRTNASWKALLHLSNDAARLGVPLEVSGAVSAHTIKAFKVASPSGQAVIGLGDKRISFIAGEALEAGAAHEFKGVWKNASGELVGLLVDIRDEASGTESALLRLAINGESRLDVSKAGHLLPGGLEQTLGAADAPWQWIYLTRGMALPKSVYSDGVIESTKGFEIRSTEPVVLNQSLCLMGQPNLYAKSGYVRVLGDESRSIVLDAREGHYGIDFPMGDARLTGVGSLDLKKLTVSATWGKGAHEALLVEVADDGADDISTLACFSRNGRDVLALFTDELVLSAPMNLNGMRHERLAEVIEFTGQSMASTKFNLPPGVRVEAVVIKVLTALEGPRFMHVGDATTVDRFATAATELKAGSVIKGLNHCDRGQSVQTASLPVVMTCDAPVTAGKVLVQVHYLNPEVA